MLAFALQQAKYRTGITCTRILTTRGLIQPVKTLYPDYHAPKQFSKLPEGLDNFACAGLCLRRISFSLGSSLLLAFVCLRLYLRLYTWVVSEKNKAQRHQYITQLMN